jgi:hypothetical protein
MVETVATGRSVSVGAHEMRNIRLGFAFAFWLATVTERRYKASQASWPVRAGPAVQPYPSSESYSLKSLACPRSNHELLNIFGEGAEDNTRGRVCSPTLQSRMPLPVSNKNHASPGRKRGLSFSCLAGRSGNRATVTTDQEARAKEAAESQHAAGFWDGARSEQDVVELEFATNEVLPSKPEIYWRRRAKDN